MTAKTKQSSRGRHARFEVLEERCLLASLNTDIRLHEVVAQGGASVTVDYEVADAPSPPFDLGFYRSSDTTFDPSDEFLGRVTIRDASDLTQGTHSATLPIGGASPIRLPGAGAAETDDDYYILAVADPDDTVAESDADPFSEDNTGILEGVYHLPGGDVFIHGTDDPETLSVLPGSLRLEIDGDVFTYNGGDVTGLRVRGHGGDDTLNFTYGVGFGMAGPFSGFIDGGPGNNTATLTGSTGDDVVNAYPHSVSMSGPGYTLEVREFSQTSVSGGGGSSDVASLFDSTGDDNFDAWPRRGLLSGPGFVNTVDDFDVIHAYANASNTDNDTASIEDSNKNDKMRSTSEFVKLYNSQFFVRAKFFNVAHVYARNGGNDVAFMSGSDGNDKFKTQPDQAKMYGSKYFVRAKFFDEVTGYAGKGTDQARMFDSKEIDRFVGTPTKARLYSTVESPGFSPYDHTARNFEQVIVYSTAGGNDKARLFDSPGNDALRGRANKTTFVGPGFDFILRRFEEVHGFSTNGGNDVAKLHDTPGDDHLEAGYIDANTTSAAMWARGPNQDLLYEVTGFPVVRAYRSTGLDTTEYAADITFLDVAGDWISPSWSADGTTDANGRVALTVGSRSVNFELVDEATGDPLAAIPVALVLDAHSASFGYLAYGDPGGAYPLQMALVTGGTVDAAVATSNDALAAPAGVQAGLDLAAEDFTKVRVKKNVDSIHENLLVKGIETFSKPTGTGIGLVKDVNGYAGLAIKALTLALGEPNSPVVGEQVFATPEAALFQVNKDLNEKNVDSLFVHAGMMVLGAVPAVGDVLLGFGVDALDAQLDAAAIARIPEGEQIVRREYATPFGKIVMYVSGGLIWNPATPFADFWAEGFDDAGNPLPRESTVDLVSMSQFGGSARVVLGDGGTANVQVPTGKYRVTVSSPGHVSKTSVIDVPAQGLAFSETLQRGNPTDPPGVTLTETGGSTDVAEGGQTDTYSIVLDSEPAGNVTVTVDPGSQVSVLQTTYTFTPANWNTPQIVGVQAVDDTSPEGNHTGTISHSISTSDPSYQGVSVSDVTVNITDNDVQFVAPGNVTGTWVGPAFLNNPLGRQDFTFALTLQANPQFTTVVTGTITDGSSVQSVVGTVTQDLRDGKNMVLNVDAGDFFFIYQLVGVATPTSMRGDIKIIDRYGGTTTGEFNLAKIDGLSADGLPQATPDLLDDFTLETLAQGNRGDVSPAYFDLVHSLGQ